MKRLPKKWRHGLIGAAAGLLIALGLWGPEMFEPTGAPEYVHVQVVAYETGARGMQWFTVWPRRDSHGRWVLHGDRLPTVTEVLRSWI